MPDSGGKNQKGNTQGMVRFQLFELSKEIGAISVGSDGRSKIDGRRENRSEMVSIFEGIFKIFYSHNNSPGYRGKSIVI